MKYKIVVILFLCIASSLLFVLSAFSCISPYAWDDASELANVSADKAALVQFFSMVSLAISGLSAGLFLWSGDRLKSLGRWPLYWAICIALASFTQLTLSDRKLMCISAYGIGQGDMIKQILLSP